MIETAPAVIPDEGILAGPDSQLAAIEGRKNPGGLVDNLHFPMDVGNLLSLGVPGIAKTARTNGASMEYERREYLECIADTFDGIASYIERHARQAQKMMAGAMGDERERLRLIADNCATLSLGPPATFIQAVQLFWFVHIIRGRNRWASTIGRLDQHLYPFYRADISAGRITREEALEVLCELWRGFNRQVDHPMLGLLNLMVGGQDADGNDATNDVSYLIIDASLSVSDTNPFVSVRIHDRTPPEFIDKVCELHLVGHGQGTVYNDEIIIPALVEYGIPLELARIYANDGCNEITIDGRSTIALSAIDALKSLELTLFDGKECPSARQAPKRHCATIDRPMEHHLAKPGFESGHLADDASFEEVFEAFMTQWLWQLEQNLKSASDGIAYQSRKRSTVPVTAGTFASVLRTGLDPLRGGVDVPVHVAFLSSIPTVGDCLTAIRKVVYEENACTLSELRNALAADWKGHEGLRQQCLAAPKYGNDDDAVDELVAEIVRRSSEYVRGLPSPYPFGIWPCLFNYTFIPVAQSCGATPDGRKWMDPVAEHFSPTPGRACNGPTAVLRSAAKSPLAACVGVAIVQISLDRVMAPNSKQGRELIKSLVLSALKIGITQLNVAIYNVEQLRDAQKHPEKYQDLIVRVWGFSARYVSLTRDMQDHIIARAVRG